MENKKKTFFDNISLFLISLVLTLFATAANTTKGYILHDEFYFIPTVIIVNAFFWLTYNYKTDKTRKALKLSMILPGIINVGFLFGLI